MVDQLRTQKLTREQIAQIFGNNPRAIKLFENLLADVSSTLPEQIAASVDLAPVYALITAQAALITAQQMHIDALEATVSSIEHRATALDALRRKVDEIELLTIGA
jgi:hypothetical protein